jgi:hypothetical protein
MEPDVDVVEWFAIQAGLEVRRARIGLRLTQLEVGQQAGISQSMVSRMELGRGSGLPLRSWIAVGDVVGVTFQPATTPPGVEPFGLRAIVLLASRGGWQRERSIASPVGSILVLGRPQRLIQGVRTTRLTSAACAVVLVADVVADVPALQRSLSAAIAGVRREVGVRTDVGGLLVVRRTRHNKRRLAETWDAAGWATRQAGGRWIAALRSAEVAVPLRPGLVWMDARATRLIPLGLRLRAA